MKAAPLQEIKQETNKGRVIISQRSISLIEDQDGNLISCKRKKGLGRPVCGDYVVWSQINNNEGVIDSIEQRKNQLSRPDSRGKIKSIASNIDQMLIISAPKPEIQFELIDRYIVAANKLKIKPVVIINKSDLLEEHGKSDLIKKELQYYEVNGTDTLTISTLTDDIHNTLKSLLENKTSILVGQSGVGKSSIIKKMIPDIDIRIGEVSEYSNEGKHTTTETTLYHTNNGGEIIDSPGVRSFRLWNLEQSEIALGFNEFLDLIPYCKFNNCKHINEPGCAITEAVANGKISKRRWNSYQAILNSLERQY